MGRLEKRMMGIVGVLGACWEMLFRVKANRMERCFGGLVWFVLTSSYP